jgi:hypothetical protein
MYYKSLSSASSGYEQRLFFVIIDLFMDTHSPISTALRNWRLRSFSTHKYIHVGLRCMCVSGKMESGKLGYISSMISCPATKYLVQSSLCIVESCPATRHGGTLGERRYSSYSFLTSALDGGEWSASRPGRALPPGKEPPVPIG